MILQINGCSIDTDAYEIRRNGELVPAEPQVFDLLVFLLKNPDRVVTKDEIIEHIWSGRSVSDAALSSRIKAVRQAIGDDGASQACIRTAYRLYGGILDEVVRAGYDVFAARATVPVPRRLCDAGLPYGCGLRSPESWLYHADRHPPVGRRG